MAVTNQTTYTAELGNGAKTAFDFAFKIFAETDLVVYKETAAGVYTQQTIVADWGGGTPAANTCWVEFDTTAETGTVHYSSAPANGLASVISRDTAETQGSSLPLEDVWSKKVVENALDKLTLLAQEVKETLTRVVLQPFTPVAPDPIEVPLPVDAKGLKWRYAAGKWYIDSTTVDAEDIIDLASASASAAAISANAASASAAAALVSQNAASASASAALVSQNAAAVSAAAALVSQNAAAVSAAAAVEISSGLYADKPLAPTENIKYYSTDREQLEQYIVVAGKWILVG